MSESFEVVIPLCPECGGDMQDMCQMSDEALATIVNNNPDGARAITNGEHFCPVCRVFAYEDEVETRTEYHRMFHHTDESSDALIEIRTSNDPNMEAVKTDWWRWENNRPVPDTNYTGVDDAFDEIMADGEL